MTALSPPKKTLSRRRKHPQNKKGGFFMNFIRSSPLHQTGSGLYSIIWAEPLPSNTHKNCRGWRSYDQGCRDAEKKRTVFSGEGLWSMKGNVLGAKKELDNGWMRNKMGKAYERKEVDLKFWMFSVEKSITKDSSSFNVHHATKNIY